MIPAEATVRLIKALATIVYLITAVLQEVWVPSARLNDVSRRVVVRCRFDQIPSVITNEVIPEGRSYIHLPKAVSPAAEGESLVAAAGVNHGHFGLLTFDTHGVKLVHPPIFKLFTSNHS